MTTTPVSECRPVVQITTRNKKPVLQLHCTVHNWTEQVKGMEVDVVNDQTMDHMRKNAV